MDYLRRADGQITGPIRRHGHGATQVAAPARAQLFFVAQARHTLRHLRALRRRSPAQVRAALGEQVSILPRRLLRAGRRGSP